MTSINADTIYTKPLAMCDCVCLFVRMAILVVFTIVQPERQHFCRSTLLTSVCCAAGWMEARSVHGKPQKDEQPDKMQSLHQSPGFTVSTAAGGVLAALMAECGSTVGDAAAAAAADDAAEAAAAVALLDAQLLDGKNFLLF